jgi:hypothetical protein
MSVTELGEYRSATGEGTVWFETMQRLETLGHGEASEASKLAAVSATLTENNLTYETARHLIPGTQIKLLNAEQVSYIRWMTEA